MYLKQYTSEIIKLIAELVYKMDKHDLLMSDELENFQNKCIELELTELEIKE